MPVLSATPLHYFTDTSAICRLADADYEGLGRYMLKCIAGILTSDS